ncbi:PREDICTED: MAGUK p55 subfamily member 7 isoform X1 [Rhagoletis zephyria]|uniref:MAGUK p55 subfamily member 7 isoform X1 n=1 Tax=Rhagoletis zephyria TaxID=28612 RepID=UPI00081149E3|nr:PREDICTED: MAGUK p55 subfamily member 7 isoform X1 [Rhagoletis zephyria]XP_017481781.1 PREDICTED: MAGUK p55 subfamily member 7 isoform X1 [Rhagoletis zephyria]XP_017481789.1 PREDICTED: MAGUK p55 subfamily member 7 isoform X1 [Rhagoletis zephyria]XP_017481796.1 PREDICTED: MAGUK p55 subfamily member 7 isoform X1 [Rhagoletis zephyria]XP_017481805.1 PREDICTED: MAGUK p55 subfamily member 7 isoform X1 [Rhagoletis zephyria]XP_017481809.1 PREDICTED: MAGUK p55 subfamily member 7 isoform X1 [Rhagolet
MTAAVMATDTNWDPALSKLITSLKEAENLSNDQEIDFLKALLESKELNALVNVHTKVAKVGRDDRLAPVLSTSGQILYEVLEQLSQRCHLSEECKEAFHLLQESHLQSLLYAHDAIAQKDFYPHLPEIPIEMDEDEETIKIVQLVKSNEPLGATIKTDEETGKIIIARIMHGGAADRSGLIHVGDEVIEVNGINVEGKTPGDVLSILQNSEGTITFKLVPSDGKGGQRESKVRVRAHFDYNPDTDPYIPCKEAGLAFQRGDILHIVSQDDAYWWQARKESERTARAGLIPSRALQERRIMHERSQLEANDADSKKGSCASICTTPPGTPILHTSSSTTSCRQPKTKKIMYDLTENDDFDREMIATYEEVSKLYPRPGVYRPVVLIGAPGVGRNELRRRLVARDPEKFRSPVPYTTRPIRTGEVAGREYIFVAREKMEADIAAGKFIEHGEYKGHLYGTSGESVKSIVNAGCVCVLSPHYQAIKALRTVQTKPFIIHIKPPEFDVLKKTRTEARAKSTFDESNARGFTDEEFNDMIKSAERIDFLYGHFFDEVIVNGELLTAFEQLMNTVQRIENEPLWAPAAWVQ